MPFVPPELIIQLKKIFPDKIPEIDVTDRELGAKVGEQRVISWLEMRVKEQEDDI